MRRLAAPMKAVAGYLAWLDLAQLGLAWLDLLAGCRFIIISAAQLADAFQSCLCARAAQTWIASVESNYVKESLCRFFFNVKMRKLHFLLSVLLAIVSAEEGAEEECV